MAATGETDERPVRRPSDLRSFDDGVHQRSDCQDRQDQATDVEAWCVGIFGVRQDLPAEEDRNRADRHVDQQHRSPPEVLEQETAGDRTQGHGRAGDCRPDPDRLGTLLGVGEHVRQDGERRREDESCPDAHQGSCGDQLTRCRGHRTECREPGEQCQAGEQCRLAAEAVGKAPGSEQEPGEDECECVDDPLQLAGCCAELANQRRKCDVHDGVVEHGDEQRQTEHGEDHPSPLVHRP